MISLSLIHVTGGSTDVLTKQDGNKVHDVTTSKEHEILISKLFEHLGSSDPVGVVLLEKLCQKIAEMQNTIESLLDTTKKQEQIIKEQALQIKEQALQIKEQALQINKLKQQIEGSEC